MTTVTEPQDRVERIAAVKGAPLLEIKDLVMHFSVKGEGAVGLRKDKVRAVDGVSLTLHEGETLGLVGEAGCGKSTTGRLITRLLKPTSGQVLYRGHDIAKLKE